MHLDSHHLLSLDVHHRVDVEKFILRSSVWPLRFDIDHKTVCLDVQACNHNRVL